MSAPSARHVDASGGLDGVADQNAAVRADKCRDLGDGLDHARLVVGSLQGHDGARPLGEPVPQSRRGRAFHRDEPAGS